AIFLRKLSGPIRWDLWVNLSETSLLLISMAVEIVIPVGILLLATWAAVRVCPGDSRRWIRGVGTLLLGGAALSAILVALGFWI
ncbi:MAG: hypothetical protein AAGD06_33000, partial [Acidobacteriota bacterium]